MKDRSIELQVTGRIVRLVLSLWALGVLCVAQPATGQTGGTGRQEQEEVAAALARRVLEPETTMRELQQFVPGRIKPVPRFDSLRRWELFAKNVRSAVLQRVVLRGEASRWAAARTKVQWQETIPGGPGYKIRKLRYEALPGLWIPALLYLPDKIEGKVPAVLNVNGHDSKGKAAPYKQIRCINQAKRGIIALNTDWLGMGQLRSSGFAHAKMNQIDLCGTSGVAVFYLVLKRALDLLLSLPQVDADRVAVTGLSGGGWQTIFISSLDTRVKLANPVAGYSSFLTRTVHLKDLGDSEQTPTDLGMIADYTVLTALVAPRPLLLTYNSKDQCCFESGYALEPLLAAARPIYKLYGHPERLRSHINDDPGTHNYERENREQFYRMLRDFFCSDRPDFDTSEIPCKDEVKKAAELEVKLPADNLDFHKLAVKLSSGLPRAAALPADRAAALKWQSATRDELKSVVRFRNYDVSATLERKQSQGTLTISYWRLRLADTWTVPAIELSPSDPKGTVILLTDGQRKELAGLVAGRISGGWRAVVLDPFYFGDCRIEKRAWLFALLLATTGERPLGVQAAQLAAAARWLAGRKDVAGPVEIEAKGPRACTIALIATAFETERIAGLSLHESFGSLKELIERDVSASTMPEMFCFGLFEAVDIKQMAALATPRPVRFINPTDRQRQMLSELKRWYAALGVEFDPLRSK